MTDAPAPAPAPASPGPASPAASPPPPCPPPFTHADLDRYIDALARELPGFAVRYKDESRLQRLIGRLVRPFNRDYLTRYTTVMFGRVWFPSRRWAACCRPADLYRILRHEAVHLRDARRYPLLFPLSYLLLPPIGPGFRALWEWRGYAESMRVDVELGRPIDDATIEHIARRFTGPDYLFMLPFPRLVRRRLRALRDRLQSASRDRHG